MKKSEVRKHKNIPVFIPHLGCPNACVFCNQRAISGRTYFDESDVERQIAEAAATLGENDEAEIAFFGGSFTGIDRDLMIRLLCISDNFVESGKVGAVRCSTRPDYIDGEILGILREHHVTTVELGLQCLDDRILGICRRGHDVETARRACKMIKEEGFSLVGQMMIGLPGAAPEDETATAEMICDMGADGARVYPTVVFYQTELCDMAREGKYVPLDTETAISRTKNVLDIFERRGVNVIRVGLCSGENLSSPEEVYGGPNHPALGELAMGELFYDRECAAIESLPPYNAGDPKRDVTFFVPVGAVSRAVGQKKKNISRIYEKYSVSAGINRIKILEKNELIGYNIKIGLLYHSDEETQNSGGTSES
ncbi:MAG: radical SAM protein [Clostridia bacterium]|nr:radical SAM protein [Clostridia bacterium]